MKGARGEAEGARAALDTVRQELAPWETRIAAAQGQCNVATAERDALAARHAAASQRLQACRPCTVCRTSTGRGVLQ